MVPVGPCSYQTVCSTLSLPLSASLQITSKQASPEEMDPEKGFDSKQEYDDDNAKVTHSLPGKEILQ